MWHLTQDTEKEFLINSRPQDRCFSFMNLKSLAEKASSTDSLKSENQNSRLRVQIVTDDINLSFSRTKQHIFTLSPGFTDLELMLST